MGLLQSSEEVLYLKSHRLNSRGVVSTHHFGDVELFQDEVTKLEYFKNVYEFLIESEAEHDFMGKLMKNNNDCPWLISMIKIDIAKPSLCSTSKALHVYFEYLPHTLQ